MGMLLCELPEDIRLRAVKNLSSKKVALHEHEILPTSSVKDFSWDRSLEGPDYWREVEMGNFEKAKNMVFDGFVLKYLISKGIFESTIVYNGRNFSYRELGSYYGSYIKENEFARTKEEAYEKALFMLKKKLAAKEKEISNIKKMINKYSK